MSQEKIIIAHCQENEAVAIGIANALKSSNFEFQLAGSGKNGKILKDAIDNTDGNVLLLISDNFLKSLECMEGGLSYLQKLINSGRTLPLVIDGQYPKDNGNGTIQVPTKFERVSSVIKYMNYWQDEYLDMRKQKRDIPADQEAQFNQKLKIVRSISSEVGEFLRFLRESYYCDLDTFKAENFQLFFQKYSDENAYKNFASQGGGSNFQKEVLAASVAAAAVSQAVIHKEEEVVVPSIKTEHIEQHSTNQVLEEVSDNTIIEIDKEAIEVSPIEEEIKVPSTEIIEEENKAKMNFPASDSEVLDTEETFTVSEEELAEDAAIDSIVDDILEEEELVEAEVAESVEIVEATTTEEDLEESVTTLAEPLAVESPEANILSDLSATAIETKEASVLESGSSLAVLGTAAVGATIIATKETKEEVFASLKESDLLRTSHELIQQDAIEEGLSLLEKNLAVNPHMVAARYQYSVFLAQFNNDYKGASEQLEKILTKDAKNLPANFFLGELAEAQGDFLSARNYYERVETINPNFPNLYYKLGLLLSRRYKNNSELAASYLQKAYEKNPRNIDALYNLGVVQNEGLSMPLDAIASFKQVLAEKPQHPFVNYDLALANYKIGDRKIALAYYEAACEINEELKTPENDLAFALPEQEEIIESNKAFLKEERLMNAAVSSNNMNGTVNNRVAEPVATKEMVEPTYTLDMSEGAAEEEVMEIEDTEDLGMIDLEELMDQGNLEVLEEAGIDEEQLEAEFDAQIGALSAVGLGIAAGAAMKEEKKEMEDQLSILDETNVNDTPSPEITEESITKQNIESEAVVIPASIREETKVASPTNKIVLITGATSGIGKATAIEFAKNGYDLILTGRRFSRLFKLKEEFETAYKSNIQLLPFDVRSAAAVKSAIGELESAWKDVDILINNAGLAMGFDPIHEGNLEDWDTMIDTNVKGLLYMTRAIAPFMVKRKKGHIINISSIAGKEVYPNGNVYCASKHAVEALTKAMRIDLHKYNIRVSQIAPGHVEETEFAQVRFHGDRDRAKIYDDFIPINSRDVAEMIYFVATRPPHVNVQDILMMGTQQASALITDKSGR